MMITDGGARGSLELGGATSGVWGGLRRCKLWSATPVGKAVMGWRSWPGLHCHVIHWHGGPTQWAHVCYWMWHDLNEIWQIISMNFIEVQAFK